VCGVCVVCVCVVCVCMRVCTCRACVCMYVQVMYTSLLLLMCIMIELTGEGIACIPVSPKMVCLTKQSVFEK